MAEAGQLHTWIVGSPESRQVQRRRISRAKAKIVCPTCNNRWMSRAQERARPHLPSLIRGEPMQLDGAAQADVANWLAMSAMTFPWINLPSSGARIPVAIRSAVRAARGAPETMRIWIVACVPENQPGAGWLFNRYRLFHLDRLQLRRPSGVLVPAGPSVVVAMSLGNLAALLVAQPGVHGGDPAWAFIGPLRNALQQIWPPIDPVARFPTAMRLGPGSFDALIASWAQWQ